MKHLAILKFAQYIALETGGGRASNRYRLLASPLPEETGVDVLTPAPAGRAPLPEEVVTPARTGRGTLLNHEYNLRQAVDKLTSLKERIGASAYDQFFTRVTFEHPDKIFFGSEFLRDRARRFDIVLHELGLVAEVSAP
jgi:hypothetical protein